MGIRERLYRMMMDALTVWRATGGNRPFTRRSMTDGELFKEYKKSQDDGRDNASAAVTDKSPEKKRRHD
ncbi:MAG: hypothetical protein LBQ00_00960 [Syntrophobacterales bacterium]|jgi:hypothetical protein|nr:hypothetical protein [Syntrophobacterales bacterium]